MIFSELHSLVQIIIHHKKIANVIINLYKKLLTSHPIFILHNLLHKNYLKLLPE